SIDIQGKSPLADHMIVASGRSHRHVAAVADHLIRALKEAGLGNSRVEGLAGADWVLIDAGDIIIHVFRPEVREFYNIEKMWQAPDLEEETLHYRCPGDMCREPENRRSPARVSSKVLREWRSAPPSAAGFFALVRQKAGRYRARLLQPGTV